MNVRELYNNTPYTYGTIKNGIFKTGDVPDSIALSEKIGLNNADTGDGILVDMPSISFRCLSRFLSKTGKDNVGVLIRALRSGRLEVMDFTLDQRISRQKSPGLGFVRIAKDTWHRSASVVVYYSDENVTILCGVDDDQYFGCAVVGRHKTLDEVLLALQPRVVRGKKFYRQGEWFIVSVEDNEVPTPQEAIVVSGLGRHNSNELAMDLPVESMDSNAHRIYGGEVRVAEDGQYFARHFVLTHDQHSGLRVPTKKWYTFHKNTAVRSFSEEGVD